MSRIVSLALLIAGCLAGLAIAHRQEVPTASDTSTPAILTGGCESFPGAPGATYTLFGLGQYSAGCEPGLPQSGIPMPSAGILQNLHVVGGLAAKAGKGGVATIWVNKKSTALTCTVDSSGTCVDTSDVVSVNAGDTVAATYAPGSGISTSVSVALEKQ